MATNSLPETTTCAGSGNGGPGTDNHGGPGTDNHGRPGTDDVAAVREFTRFYTNIIGLLREGLLDTPYSLTEARVIFELATGGPADATGLRRTLDIDAGYVSRVLARLEAGRIISRRRSPADGRR